MGSSLLTGSEIVRHHCTVTGGIRLFGAIAAVLCADWRIAQLEINAIVFDGDVADHSQGIR